MPRKKKRRKGRKEGAQSQNHKILADFWTNRIEAGREKQKHYRHAREEVIDYLKTNHDALFTDPATREYLFDIRGAAAVSVPKVAQMVNTLMPRLSYHRPHRTITPVSEDGIMIGLARVLEEYLAYTSRECKLAKQIRKAVVEGLIGGRAALQLVWDQTREVVTSKFLRSIDFVIDPDFEELEDAKWIAIHQKQPYWELERRIPKKERWRLKDLNKRAAVEKDEFGRDDRKKDELATCDMVSYWVVYSKMGRGWRGAELDREMRGRRRDDRKDFVRLEIVLNHSAPIAEGSWDVPLYLDKEWPVTASDLLDPVDSQWPQSMSGQVMPSQKVVDVLSTTRLNSCKTRDRTVILMDGKADEEAQRRLKNGGMSEFISINPPQGKTLSDTLMVADFGTGSPESSLERQFHLEEIDKTTGAVPMLMGAQEQSAQDRSATATQSRMAGSDARISDLQSRIEELTTDAARKEALTVRLELDVEEVAPYVRTSRIGLFYISIEVLDGVEIPVRDLEAAKEEDGPMALNLIAPYASNYFGSPEEAWDAARQLWEDMQLAEDPDVLEIVKELEADGIDEMDGLPLRMEIRPVTVERAWEDTAGMPPRELAREFGYEIASGSGLKIDKSQEQANADEMTQTALPAALGMGDVETANKILEIRDDAYEKPQDQRVRFNPPPPPEASGGQQGAA